MINKYFHLLYHPRSRSKNQDPVFIDNENKKSDLNFKSFRKASLVLSFFLVLILPQFVFAQSASTYIFSQSNGTYSAITGGTVVKTSINGVPNLDNYVSGSISIPSFPFAGFIFDNMYVTGNGILSLGVYTPTSSYNVLHSSSGGNFFLAPFAADLDENNTGVTEIRYEIIGNELIVQWQNFKRYGKAESINFQVRMNTSTGQI